MIKNTLLVVVLLVSVFCAKAQEKDHFVTDLNTTVSATSYELAKLKVMQFIKQNNITILSQNEGEKSYYIVFNATEKVFRTVDSILPLLGYVHEKNINTINNNNKIKEIKLQISYLETQKNEYNTELQKMQQNDRYYSYWEKVRELDRQILELNKELKIYESTYDFKVTLRIQDDYNDLTSGNIAWVNMPGATFDMLFVESPEAGVTAKQYVGYSLKYMFTRGKTYLKIGSLKYSPKEDNDPTVFKELFTYSFGQDFYTRHFGRGKNKFLNLYSSYNIGGVYATSDDRQVNMIYGQVFVGCELFKNKYILIDNKGGYFIPFSSYNRKLRGLTYEFSFNFVF